MSTAAAVVGLSSAEAERRLAASPPRPRARASRSYAEIVATNVFTLFNAILATFVVLILLFGDSRDSLFAGVLVANAAIGIVQEIRAKRVLDRIALLAAPHANVWRDGALATLAVDRVVVGDVLRLEPGDQAVADGTLLAARALTLDESALTGEADPVTRLAGEDVRSGSWCLAGSGDYEVVAAGADSWAERLAHEAQGTRRGLSPLQRDVNTILTWTVRAMVPLAALLIVRVVVSNQGLQASVAKVTAALVPLVPEGLVLLTSLTFAVAAVRLARLGTLAQRLNAVESLASVDVLCIDKTGTLTENRLDVVGIEPLDGADGDVVRHAAGVLAASAASRNGTLEAIARAVPAEPAAVAAEVPFSSARKWSGATLDGCGTVVLGAPDVLTRLGVALDEDAAARVADHAARRRRVLLLCRGEQTLDGEALPAGLRAEALVLLEEALRPDAAATVAWLTRERVAVKVISGDGAATVQAVATAVGVPGAESVLDGPEIPEDDDALDDAVARCAVFTRVTPDQKRALVRAFARRGGYVAMVGDGVNDVLALKEARLAIAMGGGSQMAKGVADLVLLSNSFATVPAAVEEGRRIIRNSRRTAGLFVTKSVWAAVLVLVVGLLPIAYAFLPRHLTIIATVCVGVPAFFLALARTHGPVRERDFLPELRRFAIPAGIIVGVAIAATYLVARAVRDPTLEQARSTALIAALAVSLAVLCAVARGEEGAHLPRWLVGYVIAVAAVTPLLPQLSWFSSFFAVVWPPLPQLAVAAVCSLAGAVAIELLQRLRVQRARAAASAPAD